MGNGDFGQFITLFLSAAPFSLQGGFLTLPLLQREGPSHGSQFSTNLSNVSPSHRLQLFTNCPSMGPSHRVQSFRNRLLQLGSPMGVTSPASKPAPLWAPLSSWIHRSWQEPAPTQASHRVTASFRHPLAPAWGPTGCSWISDPP